MACLRRKRASPSGTTTPAWKDGSGVIEAGRRHHPAIPGRVAWILDCFTTYLSSLANCRYALSPRASGHLSLPFVVDGARPRLGQAHSVPCSVGCKPSGTTSATTGPLYELRAATRALQKHSYGTLQISVIADGSCTEIFAILLRRSGSSGFRIAKSDVQSASGAALDRYETEVLSFAHDPKTSAVTLVTAGLFPLYSRMINLFQPMSLRARLRTVPPTATQGCRMSSLPATSTAVH